jgi:hypothetical protein
MLKRFDAVERNLQKISEAAIRLGAEAETLCPGPEWPISARSRQLAASSV